ncbi:hypothetical protein ONZ51_g8969 [Trametes cubensis]|uniref:Ricin B lectin domain-containing protein n=1 Tax=Trametes cubensis TaxID=1111947 RepID=A0AAD7TP55_9APHY|nr:hypothetical protein ONZ51_g8969 [Trametes cubensis]
MRKDEPGAEPPPAALQSPLYIAALEYTMTFSGDGIYRIEHGRVPVRIALARHSSEDGAAIVVWNLKDEYLDHLWLIKSVPGQADTYTIRNTVGGTYMDLKKSSRDNGTPIIGWHWTGNDNQKWIIKKETSGTGCWKIQNKAAESFIDLYDGESADGSKIVGWQSSWNDGPPGKSLGHQLWTFSPQSLFGHEIHTILKTNPYLRQDFKSYISDGMYLILSRTQLQEIWSKMGLTSKDWRSEIFDCDDFAFTFKTEVAKWGKNEFNANARDSLRNPWIRDYNPGYNAYFGVF